MSKHETTRNVCPNCQEMSVRVTRCENSPCEFSVASCATCDREQAVRQFVADHQKDCAHGPAAIPEIRSTFVAPRRAA